MVKIVIFIVFLGVLCFVQVRKFLRAKQTPETISYVAVMLLVAIVGVTLIADVRPPDPVMPLKMMCESLGRKLLSP